MGDPDRQDLTAGVRAEGVNRYAVTSLWGVLAGWWGIAANTLAWGPGGQILGRGAKEEWIGAPKTHREKRITYKLLPHHSTTS